MSAPMMSALLVGMVTTAGVLAVPVSAVAAELLPPAVRMCTITAQPLTVALVAAFTLVTSTTGNCDQPTASASIRAISIRPNRTIISDRYGPTLDIGSTQIRRSNRAEPRVVPAISCVRGVHIRTCLVFEISGLGRFCSC